MDLEELTRLLKKMPEEKIPSEFMELKGKAIFCTGNSRVALENNKAADLINRGDYKSAKTILLNGIKNAALFFPFRYNLGICYLYQNDLRRALLHFTKAQQVLPEYSKPYLRIGYIYQRWNIDSKAVYYFREALKRNRNDLNTYVLIGDIYFKKNQLKMAGKYYDASLTINHRFPNGLLGRAKILFKREKYINAIVQLKAIDTSDKYDKTLHFYFAEASFKLKDYKTAAEHYTKLLEYKNDKFFLTNSKTLIEHKLNLSRRFVER